MQEAKLSWCSIRFVELALNQPIRVRVCIREGDRDCADTGWAVNNEMQVRFGTIAGISAEGDDIALINSLLHGNHRAIFGEVEVKRDRAISMSNANHVFLTRNACIVHITVKNSRDRTAA